MKLKLGLTTLTIYSRQGDPLSPLLFVLVMESLTRPLHHQAQQPGFKYHPLCRKLHLVNICFADDLMVFCRGDLRSLDGFEQFSKVTGLVANRAKSRVHINGVPRAPKEEIIAKIGFYQGTLPIKYLEMPLSPTKWIVSDCQQIVEKVKARLQIVAIRHF